jgi:hypothetical protein
MRLMPISLVEAIYRLPFLTRPQLLAVSVPECPSGDQLGPGAVLIEIREGNLKWAHLRCPKCGDHIQLPLAGKDRWRIQVDLLRRPTLSPSVWEQASCGAHFFVRKGGFVWCR